MRKLFVILLCLGSLFLASCGEEKSEQVRNDKIVNFYDEAGAELKVEFNSRILTVAQNLKLQLRASAPEGTSIEFPEFKEKLGGFSVASVDKSAAEISTDGKTLSTNMLVILEPFLAGKYRVPSFKVAYVANGKTINISTEPQEFEVISVIPSVEVKPTLRDITGVMSIPSETLFWILLIGGIVLLLIAGGVIGYFVRRKKTPVQERILLPHEIALRDLDALIHSDLLKSAHVKEFYLGMSDILRRYIEGRFSVAAPERTTEEFLDDLKGSHDFAKDHKVLLKEFLSHCDLVKFARHKPNSHEVKDAVQSCRRFITETIPVIEPEL